MQKDDRHLNVAREHLRNAREELSMAQGQEEVSAARAAAQRAVNELDLVCRRLEHEATRVDARTVGPIVERAYQAARAAWQRSHDALNDWDATSALALRSARESLEQAMEAVEEIARTATTEEAVRP